MPTTDTSEKALESLIVAALVGRSADSNPVAEAVSEKLPAFGGVGYVCPFTSQT
jgi:hypothetical protein